MTGLEKLSKNNMDKSLKTKAVSIKGKKYVLVADRIIFFNSEYPNGCIQTQLITPFESDTIIIQATIYPDMAHPERKFTAYSQAVKGDGYINKTSALENSETSAVGRALALMGIGVIESVASVDEIHKARNQETFIAVDETKKKEIKRLCDTLDPLLKTKEQYEGFIKDKTGFDLRPENYQQIIDTLKH